MAYFAKYREYAATPLGVALNDARLGLVAAHWQGLVVDVGIGCGQFVESRPQTFGFDVNPAGVRWLVDRGRWTNPHLHDVPALTFWDSLEHIADPGPLLANVTAWAFVAIPIFEDLAHVRRSKHFRPDEHAWYFTARGLEWFMGAHGFELIASDDVESRLGREDIQSFAFRRL